MAGLTHISLQAFERRAREGRVTTHVPADLEVVVALLEVARAAKKELELVDEVQWNGYCYIGNMPCVSCGGEQPIHDAGCELLLSSARLALALASVPPETA